jgi:hypothetical protein
MGRYVKNVMYAAGVCAKGVTDLCFVLPTTKVDRCFLIEPILEKNIPSLNPGEEHRVVLYFDGSGNLTTLMVYGCLDKQNFKNGHRGRAE